MKFSVPVSEWVFGFAVALVDVKDVATLNYGNFKNDIRLRLKRFLS